MFSVFLSMLVAGVVGFCLLSNLSVVSVSLLSFYIVFCVLEGLLFVVANSPAFVCNLASIYYSDQNVVSACVTWEHHSKRFDTRPGRGVGSSRAFIRMNIGKVFPWG